MLSRNVTAAAASIWLVDANPLDLPAPPQWWQQAVWDYDKMLRVLPSQKDRVYRLARIVREEARLGLNKAVAHDHPDTRAMIKFGLVPVATLMPWAISSIQIIADLRARDMWAHFNGDPHKITDAIEATEKALEAVQQKEQDAELDERNTSAWKAVRGVSPVQVDLGAKPTAPPPVRIADRRRVALPALPACKPLAQTADPG